MHQYPSPFFIFHFRDNANLDKPKAELASRGKDLYIVDQNIHRNASLWGLRNAITETGAQFVVVDYFQIFPVEEKFQNKKDQYDSLITQLKLLQEELDVAMLLISQKNRAGYDEGVLASFMGSAGIEYGVDVAMTLEEPEMEKGKVNLKDISDSEPERKLTLEIQKNRYGPVGTIPLHFFPARNCFVEEG